MKISLSFETMVPRSIFLIMVSLIDIVPRIPRNAEYDTPFNCYRKIMCLLFLDHLINGIDMCFDKYGKTVLMMQTLIPSVIGGRDVTIDDIAEIHKDDLPVSNNCQEELF